MHATLATLLFLATLFPSANAQTIAEQFLLQEANQHRAEHHLAPLAWDAALARAARVHATRILREPATLEHQYPGEPDLTARAAHAGARFSTVAENLSANAVAPAQIDASWMASPTHRANLLDPNLNAVGISVVERRGLLFAVEDFARQTPTLRNNDIEQQVLTLLGKRGVQPAPADAQRDARATCAMASGNAGHPLLVIQWDGANLNEIPAIVTRQMPAAGAHTAAIGACLSQRGTTDSFTTYRVAILLY
jgi:hypothetical protein